jgi:single-strand DNA-binding protein
MVTFVGRITKNAVVNHLKDEREVVNFDIAINDYYKPKGSDQAVKSTTFMSCSYWLTPKIAETLTKGTLVEINGRISASAYTTMSGEAKATIQCHVNSIKIHSRNKAVAAEGLASESTMADQQGESELPF